MAGRIFVTHLKLALREKHALFWTLAFGMILGTLFYVAFHGIYSQESLDSIPTALVTGDALESMKDGEGNAVDIEGMLKELTYDNGKKMLELKTVSESEAEELLANGDVDGVISVTLDEQNAPKFSLEIKENGIGQSVLTVVVGEYQASFDYLRYLYENHPDRLADYFARNDQVIDYVEAKNIGGNNKDPYVAYFYNLMAMVCLFCSLQSLAAMCRNQADIDDVGKRTNLVPVNKVVYELSALAAVYVIQFVATSLVLCYLNFVLGVNFGGELPWMFLMTALGTLLGVSLGFMVAHIGAKSYDKKETILTVITLLGGFFAGLFYHGMKAVMEENCPIVNRINPSAVITDSFYSLNMFGPGDRVTRSVIYMLALAAVFIAIGSLLGRRQRYASL